MLTAAIDGSIITSDMIDSIVSLLSNDDQGVKSTAIELLKSLARYGASIFMSFLFLLTILLDNIQTFMVDCNVADPVAKMLEVHDHGLRGTAAGFLKALALKS